MRRKIAKYFRLSQEDLDVRNDRLKDESNSIHNQRLLCDHYIQSHTELEQMECEEFVDDGFTGANFERPSFEKMLEQVKAEEIQCIIVKDLSRFGRDYLQVGDYLEHIFPLLGIRFISINDQYDSDDHMGTTGGIDVAFRNFIYQKYSEDTSEKVKSAMHSKMNEGEYVTHCPYGYMKNGIKHQMFIDSTAAPIVREIFLSIADGKKTTEIAADLNARGIPTPLQHKRAKRQKNQKNDIMWSHQAILRIVKDYKYTGAMVNFKCKNVEIHAKSQVRIPKSEWVITENKHEAIVTHDEYYAANMKIQKLKRGDVQYTDQRDRIYYCAHCGRKLRKTFGADEYFSCATQLYIKDCVCSDIFWPKTKLEEILMTAYRSQLMLVKNQSVENVQSKSDNSFKEYSQLAKQYSREIRACESEKLQQYENYRNEKISKELFLQSKIELLNRKEILQNQLEEIENKMQKARHEQAETDKVYVKTKEVISLLDLPDEELRDKMLDAVDRVIVFSNSEIEIRWKESDLFTTLKYQYKGA